jgi:EpsI family protein
MTTSHASVRWGIVAVAFAATYLVTHAASPPRVEPPAFEEVPFSLDEWEGEPGPPLTPDEERILAADEYVRRFYVSPDGEEIEMDISYYAQPRVGSTMHSPLNCLPGNGWAITQVATRAVETPIGVANLRELIVERRGDRYALTYWFQSRDRILADEFAARFYLLADGLRRRPTDAGLVRVMMPVDGSGVAEQETLAWFASRVIPELAARLD